MSHSTTHAAISVPVAAWRLWRVLRHVMAGYLTIRFTFPRLDQKERQARVADWAGR